MSSSVDQCLSPSKSAPMAHNNKSVSERLLAQPRKGGGGEYGSPVLSFSGSEDRSRFRDLRALHCGCGTWLGSWRGGNSGSGVWGRGGGGSASMNGSAIPPVSDNPPAVRRLPSLEKKPTHRKSSSGGATSKLTVVSKVGRKLKRGLCVPITIAEEEEKDREEEKEEEEANGAAGEKALSVDSSFDAGTPPSPPLKQQHVASAAEDSHAGRGASSDLLPPPANEKYEKGKVSDSSPSTKEEEEEDGSVAPPGDGLVVVVHVDGSAPPKKSVTSTANRLGLSGAWRSLSGVLSAKMRKARTQHHHQRPEHDQESDTSDKEVNGSRGGDDNRHERSSSADVVDVQEDGGRSSASASALRSSANAAVAAGGGGGGGEGRPALRVSPPRRRVLFSPYGSPSRPSHSCPLWKDGGEEVPSGWDNESAYGTPCGSFSSRATPALSSYGTPVAKSGLFSPLLGGGRSDGGERTFTTISPLTVPPGLSRSRSFEEASSATRRRPAASRSPVRISTGRWFWDPSRWGRRSKTAPEAAASPAEMMEDGARPSGSASALGSSTPAEVDRYIDPSAIGSDVDGANDSRDGFGNLEGVIRKAREKREEERKESEESEEESEEEEESQTTTSLRVLKSPVVVRGEQQVIANGARQQGQGGSGRVEGTGTVDERVVIDVGDRRRNPNAVVVSSADASGPCRDSSSSEEHDVENGNGDGERYGRRDGQGRPVVLGGRAEGGGRGGRGGRGGEISPSLPLASRLELVGKLDLATNQDPDRKLGRYGNCNGEVGGVGSEGVSRRSVMEDGNPLPLPVSSQESRRERRVGDLGNGCDPSVREDDECEEGPVSIVVSEHRGLGIALKRRGERGVGVGSEHHEPNGVLLKRRGEGGVGVGYEHRGPSAPLKRRGEGVGVGEESREAALDVGHRDGKPSPADTVDGENGTIDVPKDAGRGERKDDSETKGASVGDVMGEGGDSLRLLNLEATLSKLQLDIWEDSLAVRDRADPAVDGAKPSSDIVVTKNSSYGNSSTPPPSLIPKPYPVLET
ncbi:hypothetical protein CBR_g51521 [Chara braunii]|uniref:Uncharacterized protein n=1 Tax=Chara braunii TaxID=69332 RepID=A0A388M8P4_CHABU|nr:hypothetical protein CBR_g51521 [Chara braunii]|eukprot:GBG90916.1 hypothetical protein CBR_g51521 [Chara braunii]